MNVPRKTPTALLTAVLVTFTTSCQPQDEHFVVTNELDVAVLAWHSSSPELVLPEYTDFDVGIQPGESWLYGLLESGERPWYHRVWPLRNWAPEVCRDDTYLHIYAEDERTWTRKPPLCQDEEWVITD